MDNAAENKGLQERMISVYWKLSCRFDYVGSTSQQNLLAEQAFWLIVAKTRACLNAANTPRKWR